MNHSPIQISRTNIEDLLDFPSLIEALRDAFAGESHVPQRHHHDFPISSGRPDSTMLLMPAWQGKTFFGLKIVTITPDNHTRELPTIQGLYLLFDTTTGSVLAQMEAKTLTNWRTAAASALASGYLSNPDSQTLLLVGTGSLAPFLIHAHASVRPIEKVLIWGRNLQKGEQLAKFFSNSAYSVEAVESLESAVRTADIISAATMSEQALIKGEWLRAGQHLDLVGSYKPNMREADDDCIRKANVFVDIRSSAPKESGDLAIPIKRGLLSQESILADLFELCQGQHPGRHSKEEITLFKSVGHALEDLAAAQLVYQKWAEQ